eukprot:642377-Hanusia_phi.AAC.1
MEPAAPEQDSVKARRQELAGEAASAAANEVPNEATDSRESNENLKQEKQEQLNLDADVIGKLMPNEGSQDMGVCAVNEVNTSLLPKEDGYKPSNSATDFLLTE